MGIPLEKVCLILLKVNIGLSPGNHSVNGLVRRMLDLNCSTVIVGSLFLTVLMKIICLSLLVLVAAQANNPGSA